MDHYSARQREMCLKVTTENGYSLGVTLAALPLDDRHYVVS